MFKLIVLLLPALAFTGAQAQGLPPAPKPLAAKDYIFYSLPAYPGSIYSGLINSVDEKKITVNGSDVPTLDQIARIDRAICAPDAKQHSLCAGDPVTSGEKPGLVMGVFPDKSLIIATLGEPLKKVESSEVSYRDNDCTDVTEMKMLTQMYKEVEKKLTLHVPTSCPVDNPN